jgi:hypothetical protein
VCVPPPASAAVNVHSHPLNDVAQLHSDELQSCIHRRFQFVSAYDSNVPEPGVGTVFETTTRWLKLYVSTSDFSAVVRTLLRARVHFQERLNVSDWGPIRVVSDTQKCHAWFPSVLHSLLPSHFLNTPLPVPSSSEFLPLCEAVVEAAHLVEEARSSRLSQEDVEFLMTELLGCSRQAELI